MPSFNDRIRQVILLGIILLIGLLLFNELKIFLPGLMGALTIYILTREIYFNLTIKRQWKKGLTALLMILGFLILIGLPIYMGIRMISPKVNHILQNPQPVLDVIQKVSAHIQASTGMEIATPENMKSLAQRISTVIPQMLNSTAVLLANVLLMFFALYYLLVQVEGVREWVPSLLRADGPWFGIHPISAGVFGVPMGLAVTWLVSLATRPGTPRPVPADGL